MAGVYAADATAVEAVAADRGDWAVDDVVAPPAWPTEAHFATVGATAAHVPLPGPAGAPC